MTEPSRSLLVTAQPFLAAIANALALCLLAVFARAALLALRNVALVMPGIMTCCACTGESVRLAQNIMDNSPHFRKLRELIIMHGKLLELRYGVLQI